MSQKFWSNFSAVSKATFGVPLSDSSLGVGLRPTPDSPAELLKRAGMKSLDDVVRRRERAELFKLGLVDERDNPNPLHAHITESVKDLFLSDSHYLQKGGRSESTARRPSQYFDVRSVGSAEQSLCDESHGEDVRIFCCRYGETAHAPTASRPYSHPSRSRTDDNDVFLYTSSRKNPEKLTLRTIGKNDITLAIPSSAGLKAPEAVSLINPLCMQPREYIDEGEAGAIVCMSPSTFQCVADLYWSREAFIHSLNKVQDIGRLLIEVGAMNEAVQSGVGVVEVQRASAILARLYEAVAQVGQARQIPFFSAGVWGVAVEPQSNNTFVCVLGVVAILIPEIAESSHDKPQTLLPIIKAERNFAVVNLVLQRDTYGFLKIEAANCALRPLEPLPWYRQLPEVA